MKPFAQWPLRARRALWLGLLLLLVLALGYSLVRVFNNNLVFFYTPQQILSGQTPTNQKSYRLGGMVERGSVQREQGSLKVRFVVYEQSHRVPVEFTGIVPDLFKEGSGVVADGLWDGQVFKAT